MSVARVTVTLWTCDECDRDVKVAAAPEARDDLMPEGWIHTMMGRDLCQWCQS